MPYAELFPTLLAKGLIQTRSPPNPTNSSSPWYKADQSCPYHQGAPGHNIENCFSFKVDVQRLVKSGMLSFKDTNPNVQANPLPQHKEASVNLIDQHPNVIQIYDIRQIGENLVKMHAKQAGYDHVPPHNYFTCEICPKNNQGCAVVQAALQEQMDLGWIQHIRVRTEHDINMVQGCPGEYKIYKVEDLEGSVVRFHKTLNGLAYFGTDFHAYSRCEICRRNSRGCLRVRNDIQKLMDDNTITVLANKEDDEVFTVSPQINQVEPMQVKYDSRKTAIAPLVIYLPGPVPYESDKAIPYKYNATFIENGKETPLLSVVNIADVSRVTRSGRVFNRTTENVEKPSEEVPHRQDNHPTNAVQAKENDEILKLIQRSEYNIVDQLLHTPSRISVLSLLLSSEAHREALQKVLEQAFVEPSVTISQFNNIVANISAGTNLSFCDEDLPEEGVDHNLPLHISVGCMGDVLTGVLIDNGSSLNVMPKSTLSRLSFEDYPLRKSHVIVKAFDGSRKSVFGEVDLPITIGPQTFKITFQVMDIPAQYSCLLGRPWIHEAGAITSTLHQKLKFIRNDKLVTVCGERALIVSNLSSFSDIEPKEVVGTKFQALSLDKGKEKAASISSYKDAIQVIKDGTTSGWGHINIPTNNKNRTGIGFFPTS
ncbi:uncharacterized protein LOC131595775 [Vicia villosa]|uniref:uncharacterized protein LOC131595775 n=1 Tax=Vicia villosa TaxID=3911 RepID=UPI00273C9F08|nr:uncharacterized protein LOC131595775 [Vicia villosa]XP_058724227.1 uncharacterized protein LOC131595775 [Vicia villosa]